MSLTLDSNYNTMHEISDNKGEILFRVCAYALTGLLCTFYVIIFGLLLFFIFSFLPAGTVYSTKTGYTIYGIIHTTLLTAIIILPNFLGWFLAFLYPLKRNSQTWGMKMFGLKAKHQNEEHLSWKSSLLQEGLHMFLCSLFIGIIGLILAIFKKNEKTIFNEISGISIIQTTPGFKFVEEFRKYRLKV